MKALGLKQHSITPTHKSDNILDLIFTEIPVDIGVEVVETATTFQFTVQLLLHQRQLKTESYLQGN